MLRKKPKPGTPHQLELNFKDGFVRRTNIPRKYSLPVLLERLAKIRAARAKRLAQEDSEMTYRGVVSDFRKKNGIPVKKNVRVHIGLINKEIEKQERIRGSFASSADKDFVESCDAVISALEKYRDALKIEFKLK
jgi:hypothetical protein